MPLATVAIALVTLLLALLRRARTLRIAAIVSSALVLPLLILEIVKRRQFQEGFPLRPSAILWLLPGAFMLILMPAVRDPLAPPGVRPNPLPA